MEACELRSFLEIACRGLFSSWARTRRAERGRGTRGEGKKKEKKKKGKSEQGEKEERNRG